MSSFTGTYDLFDTIMMRGEHDLQRNQDEDDLAFEIRCLEHFAKRINYELHQSFKLDLNIFNIDKEIETVNNPKILRKESREKVTQDKRCKSGIRTKEYYVYFHYDREYAKLEDINYYADRVIKIESPLDLVLYYPYCSAVHASDKTSEFIRLANKSELDERELSFRESGLDYTSCYEKKKRLMKHYQTLSNYLLNNKFKTLYNELDLLLTTEKDEAQKEFNDVITQVLDNEAEQDLVDKYHFKSGYYEAAARLNIKIKEIIEKVI